MLEEYDIEELIPGMFKVTKFSNPENAYIVRKLRFSKGQFVCSCRSYLFSGRSRTCKHVSSVEAFLRSRSNFLYRKSRGGK